MSRDREIISLLSEVHERVVRIETKMENLPEMQIQLKKHSDEILKFKTTMKILKWLGGLCLITVPATVAAVVRAFKF